MAYTKVTNPPTGPPMKAWLSLCVWLIVVGAGWVALGAYANTAGAQRAVPNRWPKNSKLKWNPNALNVVIFVHPKCSCSQATINLYREVESSTRLHVQTQVAFYCPSDESESWAEDRLWRSVGVLPNVIRLIDRGGQEVKNFGVTTSGHVVVYSPNGELLFSGGITSRRAHEGESLGSQTLKRLFHEKSHGQLSLPVFGCRIFPEGAYREARIQ